MSGHGRVEASSLDEFAAVRERLLASRTADAASAEAGQTPRSISSIR